MSFGDVTIAREGKLGYTVRMMSRIGSARRIWENFEKSVSRVETRHRTRRLAFASSRGLVAGAARDDRGAEEKARIERLCLSLLMSKNL